LRFPTYYDDKGMNCGGFSVQWQQNSGKCGICGENYSLEPKKFEKNGSMYKGYIVKTYQQGEIITVNVEITANHLGYFQFMICNLDQMLSDATTDCLNKTYLKEATSNQTKIYIQSQTGYIYTKLKLPDQLTCNHCVFQWKYNTGNSWGTDRISGQSGLGLGIQEQFFGNNNNNFI
jgi:hypothetical protein